ncbi:MAG: glycosyltransferase [Proteobacteria bacterium]|nr:glycosyltransferase [Pseudomonadota bacterium]
MDLSIVIPVFRGGSTIAGRLRGLSRYLERTDHGLDYELVVVDDGSGDGTGELLERLDLPRLAVVKLAENRGKYSALKVGMGRATGACRLFTDADVPYEHGAVLYMARHVIDRGVHVVIGDRRLRGSRYCDELGPVRRALTGAFTLVVRLLVTSGLGDTQCGIKAFRGDVAAALFPLLRESGFAGDVELLYIALGYNLEIKRVPVRLVFQAPSTVRPGRDALRMLGALTRIRRRRVRGEYRNADLEALAHQDYWSTRDA